MLVDRCADLKSIGIGAMNSDRSTVHWISVQILLPQCEQFRQSSSIAYNWCIHAFHVIFSCHLRHPCAINVTVQPRFGGGDHSASGQSSRCRLAATISFISSQVVVPTVVTRGAPQGPSFLSSVEQTKELAARSALLSKLYLRLSFIFT